MAILSQYLFDRDFQSGSLAFPAEYDAVVLCVTGSNLTGRVYPMTFGGYAFKKAYPEVWKRFEKFVTALKPKPGSLFDPNVALHRIYEDAVLREYERWQKAGSVGKFSHNLKPERTRLKLMFVGENFQPWEMPANEMHPSIPLIGPEMGEWLDAMDDVQRAFPVKLGDDPVRTFERWAVDIPGTIDPPAWWEEDAFAEYVHTVPETIDFIRQPRQGWYKSKDGELRKYGKRQYSSKNLDRAMVEEPHPENVRLHNEYLKVWRPSGFCQGVIRDSNGSAKQCGAAVGEKELTCVAHHDQHPMWWDGFGVPTIAQRSFIPHLRKTEYPAMLEKYGMEYFGQPQEQLDRFDNDILPYDTYIEVASDPDYLTKLLWGFDNGMS